jgi:hypothetical protein
MHRLRGKEEGRMKMMFQLQNRYQDSGWENIDGEEYGDLK